MATSTMDETKKPIDLLCEFCQKKCGEIGSLEEVVDIRCGNCQTLHGEYVVMEQMFKRDISRDHQKFLDFMARSEKKVGKFTENLLLEYPEFMVNTEINFLRIEEEKKLAKVRLGISKLSKTKQVEKLKALKYK